MAAGSQQVAAAALVRAHPRPAWIPIGHARQVLEPRKHQPAEPTGLAQPLRKSQVGVVVQFERHDRAYPGARDGVADGLQLRQVQAGRLLEQDVFAGLRGGDSLCRMQMVWRRNRNDVDVGRAEQILIPRRESRLGHVDAGVSQSLSRASFIASAERDDAGRGIGLEGLQVLRGHPAWTNETDTEDAICSALRPRPSYLYLHMSVLALMM